MSSTVTLPPSMLMFTNLYLASIMWLDCVGVGGAPLTSLTSCLYRSATLTPVLGFSHPPSCPPLNQPCCLLSSLPLVEGLSLPSFCLSVRFTHPRKSSLSPGRFRFLLPMPSECRETYREGNRLLGLFHSRLWITLEDFKPQESREPVCHVHGCIQ